MTADPQTGELIEAEAAGLPRVEWKTFTPSEAQKALMTRAANRRISQRAVARYVQAMRAGKWQVTGDTIKFDRDGRLRDGQHRLMAAVEVGVPFTALTVWGIDPDSIDVIDIGNRRTAADVLEIYGFTEYTAALPAVVGVIITHERVGSFRRLSMENRPDHHDILEWVREHPDVLRSVRAVYGASNRGGFFRVPLRALAAAHYLFSQRDHEEADQFIDALLTGANLPSTSPILHLRNRLQQVGRESRATMPAEDVGALTIKAWNAWRARRAVQRLTWHPSEEFPAVE